MKGCWMLVIAVWGLVSCHREVDVPFSVDFSYDVVDQQWSVPTHLLFTNKTQGGLLYKWTFEGGSPATYDKKDPGVVLFHKAGRIAVKLEAWNGDTRLEKTIEIVLDSAVKADFEAVPVVNHYGPTDFRLVNRSQGATRFRWLFDSTAASSSLREPALLHYENPGRYLVRLEVWNDRGVKDTVSKVVTVQPPLAAAFDVEPSFDDEDYEAPLTAQLHNRSFGATVHQWTVSGGVLSNSADSLPTVHFDNPGTYTIGYTATNGKQTQTVSRTITVLPNTGLRTFRDVKLGINTAHGTIGSFFSTRLRKVFKSGEVTTANGGQIDLVFFGLNSYFTYNLFVRPDSVQAWTFAPIPNATVTRYVNTQEQCHCGPVLTPEGFDAVQDGQDLEDIVVIENTGSGAAFSSAVVPRVVLFQNAWGKKGAIKIKQYAANGLQSYIVCDIKVQKD